MAPRELPAVIAFSKLFFPTGSFSSQTPTAGLSRRLFFFFFFFLSPVNNRGSPECCSASSLLHPPPLQSPVGVKVDGDDPPPHDTLKRQVLCSIIGTLAPTSLVYVTCCGQACISFSPPFAGTPLSPGAILPETSFAVFR